MEGEMKDIVLQRLEQRLTEKDEELHTLKKELQASDAGESLKERVDTLETEVRETQMALSQVMKKVGALESTLNSMLMSMANSEDEAGPEDEFSIQGTMPIDAQPFGKFAASADQKDNKENGESKTGISDDDKEDDASRFFHLSKNS